MPEVNELADEFAVMLPENGRSPEDHCRDIGAWAYRYAPEIEAALRSRTPDDGDGLATARAAYLALPKPSDYNWACFAKGWEEALRQRPDDAVVEALREARQDTHLVAMTSPHHCADSRYTGERIREAADRLARIDATLSENQP